MPFLMSRASPTTSYTSSTSTCTTSTTTTTSSSQGPSRKVSISDEELLSRIHYSESSLALQHALADPVSSWDSSRHTSCISLSSTARRETFELSTRSHHPPKGGIGHNGNNTLFEVLAVGCIACSPQELVSVLRPQTESEYNVAMNAVYGREFIYGAVVHTLDSTVSSTSLPPTHQLSVKTGCFARSKLLARNEQWCFLDYFQPNQQHPPPLLLSPSSSPSSPGFSIASVSLSRDDLTAGKAVEGRIDHLDNISTFLVVESVPAVSKDVSDGNATKLRLTFYASYNEHVHEPQASGSSASAKATRDRVVALAKGIPRLPAVVRRRRLGVQVFATRSVTGVLPPTQGVKNARCISCTKGIRLRAFLQSARRCQLCAYNVCTACWSREPIETTDGSVVALGVCTRCLEWVDRCDYSNVTDGSRGPPRIIDDPVFSSYSCSKPTSKLRPAIGRSFREDLAVESTKEAAVTVIQMLLNRYETRDHAMRRENPTAQAVEVNEYMSAVEEYFQRRANEAPAARDCVLANCSQRAYALEPKDDLSCPPAPIPANEVARLECITRLGLMDWRDPIPELDIICSFLSREFGFFCTMVAIVGATHQLVLSCTITDLVHALLPREHTFCQHLVMGDAPFIVRHPEADVRFYNLHPVKFQGAKYYCGIPVFGAEGVMVGSICCVHSSTMDITRMQYDTLVRFGEIASRIIRMKAEAMQQSKSA